MTATSTTTVAWHGGRNPSQLYGASSVLNAKPNSEAQRVISVSKLDVTTLPCDRVLNLNLALSHTALSTITVPILAYRSRVPGPTVGIVAAIHGNEINGVPVIQKLFNDIRTCTKTVTHGSVVGVLVLNVPGFLDSERGQDGQDLNRLMPGKKTGTSTQQYAYQVFHEMILKFDYLVDLHTASRGRKNSLYVRADMNQPTIKEMAQSLQPQIIVHNSSPGGSIRGCAQSAGINAVTVEIGDCSVFQFDLIEATNVGLSNILRNIGLLGSEGQIIPTCKTVECERSYWVFSSQPGILRVYKSLAERLQRGSLIAEVQTIFGEIIEAIHAPTDYDTVVVGLENNPVAKRGSRVKLLPKTCDWTIEHWPYVAESKRFVEIEELITSGEYIVASKTLEFLEDERLPYTSDFTEAEDLMHVLVAQIPLYYGDGEGGSMLLLRDCYMMNLGDILCSDEKME